MKSNKKSFKKHNFKYRNIGGQKWYFRICNNLPLKNIDILHDIDTTMYDIVGLRVNDTQITLGGGCTRTIKLTTPE